MGKSDEFGLFPDVDSNVAPSDLKAWSIAPSAEEQARVDLETQTNLRKVAEQRAAEISARCSALQEKLDAEKAKSSRKRKTPDTEATVPVPRTRKKPSPIQPLLDLMASQPPPLTQESDQSDDEVPEPDEAGAKKPTFHQLNSILCEYKDGNISPSFDGEFPYKICAEMCTEEADDILNWSPIQKQQRRPMIISALRLTYKDKRDEWFRKPFLMSPEGASSYWRKVLQRRAEIWQAAHLREKAKREAKTRPEPSLLMTSVHDRLKAKLRARVSEYRTDTKQTKASPGHRASPIVIDTSSDSESGSSSPHENAATGEMVTEGPMKKSQKLAPGPETYSVSEIKRFASMAKTIKHVDESRGHSAAVADFVDLEFSDNTGMMTKARRAAKDSWKKNRFNDACAKAAHIMEERSV